MKLEASATDREPARSGAAVKRRRRRSKSALVLGGGGFTGGVYEIGALRALNLLSVNRTVNEFDVYVGTSAGAFVAAAVANGVTPDEMMREADHESTGAWRTILERQDRRCCASLLSSNDRPAGAVCLCPPSFSWT